MAFKQSQRRRILAWEDMLARHKSVIWTQMHGLIEVLAGGVGEDELGEAFRRAETPRLYARCSPEVMKKIPSG